MSDQFGKPWSCFHKSLHELFQLNWDKEKEGKKEKKDDEDGKEEEDRTDEGGA